SAWGGEPLRQFGARQLIGTVGQMVLEILPGASQFVSQRGSAPEMLLHLAFVDLQLFLAGAQLIRQPVAAAFAPGETPAEGRARQQAGEKTRHDNENGVGSHGASGYCRRVATESQSLAIAPGYVDVGVRRGVE